MQIKRIFKTGNGNRRIIYHDKNGPVMGIGNAANIFTRHLRSDMVTYYNVYYIKYAYTRLVHNI
jgi:hypothetical protein